MSEKIKRALMVLGALGALALGGAAIAGAASGGSDEQSAEQERGDGDGELSAAVEQQARAAAERETGGTADGDVEPAEPADPVEDPEDQPTPAGAAYEVEISKGDQDLKVFLDDSFRPLETQVDAG